MNSNAQVLVTGVTGFIGAHLTIQLLNKEYQVRGSLRNMDRAEEIRSVIAEHAEDIERLSFVEADLLQEKVWQEAMQGVDYVMHVASPFPRLLPKNDEELIRPARQGTLHVLQAAAANGVKKVVLTSSSGAIMYGKDKARKKGTYTEKDWTDVSNRKDTTAYLRSKTLAERAAWDFMEKDNSGMSLSVICPGAVLGPVLEKDFGTSANVVIKLLDGGAPGIPDMGFDFVDVRSVADLHIRAMESPKAENERFAASNGFLKFRDLAEILQEAYPGRRVPKRILPNWAVRAYSLIDPSAKPILIDLGAERKMDCSKARQWLGWEPIAVREAVKATAETVIRQGIV